MEKLSIAGYFCPDNCYIKSKRSQNMT